MAFRVYDFRDDICHQLVTPHIRSRFMRMEPGQVADRHSHDLGHEIFLILQGRAIFEIAGEEAELGPGQLCIALVDEPHQVRVVSEEPVIMYLSMTPHIQQTHTGRTATGEPLPIRFAPSRVYDVETDEQTPIDQLIDRYGEAASDLAAAAQENARVQRETADALKEALAAGDEEAANAARLAMWQTLSQTFKQAYAMADLWNDLTPRAGSVG